MTTQRTPRHPRLLDTEQRRIRLDALRRRQHADVIADVRRLSALR